MTNVLRCLHPKKKAQRKRRLIMYHIHAGCFEKVDLYWIEKLSQYFFDMVFIRIFNFLFFGLSFFFPFGTLKSFHRSVLSLNQAVKQQESLENAPRAKWTPLHTFCEKYPPAIVSYLETTLKLFATLCIDNPKNRKVPYSVFIYLWKKC